MKKYLLFWVGLGFWFFPLVSQAQHTKKHYQQEAGIQALLYQGKLEKGYGQGYVNTSYRPLEYTEGSLTFEGMEYKQVLLRFNCELKRLILQSPDRKFNIILLPEQVQRATIGAWEYVYLDERDRAPEANYYMAVFEGQDWSIYKQYYISNIKKVYEGSHLQQEFSIKERVYLKKDGKWTVINGRNDFIKHFKTHKEALLEYCKQQKLRPGDKREDDWLALARYCETLIK